MRFDGSKGLYQTKWYNGMGGAGGGNAMLPEKVEQWVPRCWVQKCNVARRWNNDQEEAF